MLEKKIKMILIDDGIKQRDLAVKLKVSSANVSKMLKDGMSLHRFEEVCGMLGYDIFLKKGDRVYGVKSSDLGKH